MVGFKGGPVLGVDVGTSHSVAVLTWPEGRVETLLVDSSPVMPSAVYLDESGVLHVGRDALRLAQIDPARFEPNPKQRVGEGAVLLGDKEIADVDLLSAVLRTVAAKAAETVGYLPPTVLTYPAKWAKSRRDLLLRAAADAGMPADLIVTEPVAAAHYFAGIMRQPVGVNDTLAVFDFGGGTLDVAVVRRREQGSFAVLSDGGLDDLGGLDVDAALVEHTGRLIGEDYPEVWQGLSSPVDNAQLRQRREFWDHIRGAKEMLSRTTVAQVRVPGAETALHLTRDELDRVTQPLFERAVAETRRVIEAAGVLPANMAGLFLVGGASRIPMAARMLHFQLGIAPTVMEQPELPVASGAVLAAQAAPETAESGKTAEPPPLGRYQPSTPEVMAPAAAPVDAAEETTPAEPQAPAVEADGAHADTPAAAPPVGETDSANTDPLGAAVEQEPPHSRSPRRRLRILISGAATVLFIAGGIIYFALGGDICDDAHIAPLQEVATQKGEAESDSSNGQVFTEHCYIPFEGTDLNIASMDIFRETYPDADAAQAAYEEMYEEDEAQQGNVTGDLDDVTGRWLWGDPSEKYDRQYKELEELEGNEHIDHVRGERAIDVVLVEGEMLAGVRWLVIEEPGNRDLPDTMDALSATAQSVI